MKAMLLFFIVVALPAPVVFAESGECPHGWRAARPPESNMLICWQAEGETLRVEMSHPGRVWLALGFGANMADADAVIGRLDSGGIVDAHISGYDAESIVADASQNITDAEIVFDGGRTVMRFSRPLATTDKTDYAISAAEETPVIWAAGQTPGFAQHFSRGALVIEWHGRGASFWTSERLWHAGAMMVAWGIMMPLGVLIARYYKVLHSQDFPRELDNQFWWNWHRILQYGGVAVAAFGAVPVWLALSNDDWHAIFGYAALCLVFVQVAGGILRGSKGGPVDDDGNPNPPDKIRGDHYDMTLHRRIFEAAHKSGGYVALLAGAAAMVLGSLKTGNYWLTGMICAWICVFFLWFLILEKSGKRVDTYAAIWGGDARHPGNRLRTGGKNEN